MRPTLALALFLLSRTAAAQGLATPGPQDIPQPMPGEGTLAGDPRPDITRFLNVRQAKSPTLSPRGDRISFLTDTTGQPQLWRQAIVDDRTPHQLTFGGSSVTFQEWSPTDEWIAYGTDRGGNEREGYYLISPDGLLERELLPASEAFRQWGGFSPDGRRIAYSSTERNGTDFDVYVLDVSADGRPGRARLVQQGTGGLYVAAWRPDGGALILVQPHGEADSNVFLLDLARSRMDTLFLPPDGARFSHFAWTPDGRGFYMVSNHGFDKAGIAYVEVQTKKVTWVASPESEVEELALVGGQWLAWTTNRNSYSKLFVDERKAHDQPLAGTRADLPAGVYALDASDRLPLLTVAIAGIDVPGDVWLLDLRRGSRGRITDSATGGLNPASFRTPEGVSFKSWDGETIHGLLYMPDAGASGGQPPILISVHGGPTAQARPDFDPALQYLLTRGIAVLDLNFRGSTGYGKRFTRLDDRGLRGNAVKDLGGALDWLAGTRRVDASRAAVMGGSYGGFLTFAAITEFPERFKAAVGFVGVSNWITALTGASPALKASDRLEYGNIDDPQDRAFLMEISPITHAARVRTPLLALHGANDPRDPVAETDQFVTAIRGHRGVVEYLRFPDEGHGIRKLQNRIIAYRRIAAFLEKHLGVAAVGRGKDLE